VVTRLLLSELDLGFEGGRDHPPIPMHHSTLPTTPIRGSPIQALSDRAVYARELDVVPDLTRGENVDLGLWGLFWKNL
jgi:hypothetical protein